MQNLESWTSKTVFSGQRYGRYTVLATYRKIGTYKYYAKCQCDCGSPERYVLICPLRSGESQSCGCLHKERVTKHGAWSHPLFHIWRGMMSRCYNNKDQRYNRYGGRGILVCERWHDVNAFLDDMFPTFLVGLQIDRTDNDKGYSLDNCRWVDRGVQARNKSSNIVLNFNNQSHCLAEWARITGLPYSVLWDRVKAGWATEKALTQPVMTADESTRNARNVRWGSSQ